MEYETGVHYEAKFHEMYSLELYRKNRLSFLEGALGRERIFLTDYFYKKYEERARENVGKLIGMLR